EANAQVTILSLYTMFSLPNIDQVYIMYRGKLENSDFGPGSESLEVKLCEEKDIPWESLAFPVITETLRLYYRESAEGHFSTHTGDIWKTSRAAKDYQLKMLKKDKPEKDNQR
ncbi:MAG: hypothetical protein ACC635_06520, partial [Acidiferrobacterales bacterium]